MNDLVKEEMSATLLSTCVRSLHSLANDESILAGRAFKDFFLVAVVAGTEGLIERSKAPNLNLGSDRTAIRWSDGVRERH